MYIQDALNILLTEVLPAAALLVIGVWVFKREFSRESGDVMRGVSYGLIALGVYKMAEASGSLLFRLTQL